MHSTPAQEPANLPAGDVTPMGLTVAAVARRLGIAPDTLRTWDRRYGLGATAHSSGSHRRYSADDVARLDMMRALVTQGVAPAEAARLAKDAKLDSASLTSTNLTDAQVSQTAADANSTPAGGGNILSLEGEAQLARGLSRAATMLDSVTCQKMIRQSLAEHGVLATWKNLISPVLMALGEKWEKTGQGVETEHMLAEIIHGELRLVMDEDFTPVNARPVMLVSAPAELHTLPLFAIGALMAEYKIASRVLGARTPSDAVASACTKLGPAAVIVWSQSRGTADDTIWSEIPTQRPTVAQYAAGPGWVDNIPDHVTRITSLEQAIEEICRALRVSISF